MPNGEQQNSTESASPSSLYTGREIIRQVLEAVQRKQSLLQRHGMRYFCRAIMAGVLIGLFFAFSITIKTLFAATSGGAVAGLLSAIAFSFALVFIFFTNSELLTSNFMYFTVGQYYKKIRTLSTLKIYLICFLGNVTGCAIIAALIHSADILNPSATHAAYMITHAKTIESGCWEIFVRAIFANFFINIAIVIAMQLKEALPKIAILMTGIIVFVVMGYEHVIANTSIFLTALFENHEVVNLLAVGKSTLFSFLGNLVGGGLAVGLFYAYLNDSREKV